VCGYAAGSLTAPEIVNSIPRSIFSRPLECQASQKLVARVAHELEVAPKDNASAQRDLRTWQEKILRPKLGIKASVLVPQHVEV
jgi:hypothetical protein